MSVTKQQLHDAVLTNQGELIDLCSQLIRIKNQSPVDDQRPAIRFVQDWLAGKGIATELLEPDPAYPVLIARMGRADGEGFRVVLNGHVDVVPVGDLAGWDFDPFGGEVRDGKILGRGTSDMKCGLATLMYCMGLLAASGAELDGDIRLHVVSDEEIAGHGTRWLCENGYADGADAVVIGEPTGHDNIEIGQKGILHLTIHAAGVPGHGSTGNYKGENAILKLCRVLPHVVDLIQVPGHFLPEQATALANSRAIAERTIPVEGIGNVIDHLAANVGIIEGGNKINMVPDHASAQVDVRLPCGADHAEIVAAVDALVAKSGETGITVDYDWIAEGNYTSDTCTLVTSYTKNIEAIWGHECLPAYQWASSDAKYYRDLGLPTIQFGPANNEGIHGYNEDVDVADVVHAAEIHMLSLADMLGIA